MARRARGVSDVPLARDGFERCPGAAAICLTELLGFFDGSHSRAGRRISNLGAARTHLARDGVLGSLAVKHLGPCARPVRAIAFDKCDDANWALGWHQDRTIAVQARRQVAGFGPWTTKQGLHHVEPPADLLARMVTMRIHIDPVDSANAPLKVAPTSHRLGRIDDTSISGTVGQLGETHCLADQGDVWLYMTLIVHASDRAAPGRRRRVLQVDYAANDLPGGLQWLDL